jgi:hypothetical protein
MHITLLLRKALWPSDAEEIAHRPLSLCDADTLAVEPQQVVLG